MKKIYLFLFSFLILSSCLNAQKLDSITSYDYDTSTHQFYKVSNQSFSYNGSCNLVKYQYSFYDSALNKYNNYLKTTNSLLANSAISQSLTQLWDDAANKWSNYQKSIYNYTSNPKLPNTVQIQTWNTTTNSWVNSSLNTYTYDANGNDTSTLIQNWQSINNTWVNYNLYKTSYNAQNSVTQFLQLEYNIPTNTWINYLKVNYLYNAQQKLLNDITQKWTNNTWKNIDRNEYNYDANNYLINSQYDSWDSTSNTFNPTQKSININNSNGTAKTTYTLNYNTNTLNWDTISKDENRYNSCILPIQFVEVKAKYQDKIIVIFSALGFEKNTKFELEKSIDGKTFFKINSLLSEDKLEYTFVDEDKNSASNYYRIKAFEKDGKFVYSNIVFIDLKINNNLISIYPNPVINGRLSIYTTETSIAQIFDLFGKEKLQFSLKNGINSIDVSAFNKGYYFIKIKNRVEKILVQ